MSDDVVNCAIILSLFCSIYCNNNQVSWQIDILFASKLVHTFTQLEIYPMRSQKQRFSVGSMGVSAEYLFLSFVSAKFVHHPANKQTNR